MTRMPTKRVSEEYLERLSGRGRVSFIGQGLATVDGFLTEAECSTALEELEVAAWQPSLVYTKHDDGIYRDVSSPLRVSETAQQRWFPPKLEALILRVERRLEKVFGIDRAHLETWQATTYPRRGQFYYHLDAGYWEGHHAGDRILTFLVYLTTPERGGGTHFRALDRHVEARAGRLLVWNNLFPEGSCDHRMIHSSAPLLKGKKTTLITWQRQRRYQR